MKFSISTLLLLVSFVAMSCGSYTAAGLDGILSVIFVAGIGLVAFGLIHRSRWKLLVGLAICLGQAGWFIAPSAIERWQKVVLVRDLGGPNDNNRQSALTELLDRRVDPTFDLVRLLGDSDVGVREFASKALIELRPFNPEAITPLVTALSDESATVRSNAATAIGERLKQADPLLMASSTAAVRGLLQVTVDDVASVRFAASVSLLGLGSRYHEQAAPGIIEAIQSADSAVHRYAIFHLGELGPLRERAIPVLIELMQKRGDPRARASAIEAIGQMGPLGAPAVPVLIELLQNGSDRATRASAIKAIEDMVPDGAPTAKSLFDALRNERVYSLQVAIARALGNIGPAAEPAIPLLKAMRDIEIPAEFAKGTVQYFLLEIPKVAATDAIERITREEVKNMQGESTNTDARRHGSIP